jgi:hypothetical protein
MSFPAGAQWTLRVAGWTARQLLYCSSRRRRNRPAKDLLIRLRGIVSGGVAQGIYSVQPAGDVVPTGAGQVHQPHPLTKSMTT